jgi:hypothetical protein
MGMFRFWLVIAGGLAGCRHTDGAANVQDFPDGEFFRAAKRLWLPESVASRSLNMTGVSCRADAARIPTPVERLKAPADGRFGRRLLRETVR